MIKKLLLTFSFIALVTVAFSGATYAAAEGETIVISEELAKLNNLYKEGAITEEEFSKAKSLLLNPNIQKKTKRTAVDFIEQSGTTAVERKRLKEAEQAEIKALKEQLRAEKKAERERIKQATLDEKNRILEEREKACSDDPKSAECKAAKSRVTNIYDKLKRLTQEIKTEEKKEGEQRKITAAERKQLKEAERDEKKALKEQLRAEKEAEKKRIIAERNKIIEEKKEACSDDPKSAECKKARKQVSSILEKAKMLGQEIVEREREKRKEERQAIKERKEKIKKRVALEKQTRLEEEAKINAEKAARKAERARLKAEWRKACLDDPEGKACKEGKPSEKIKNVLKEIGEKLGG